MVVERGGAGLIVVRRGEGYTLLGQPHDIGVRSALW